MLCRITTSSTLMVYKAFSFLFFPTDFNQRFIRLFLHSFIHSIHSILFKMPPICPPPHPDLQMRHNHVPHPLNCYGQPSFEDMRDLVCMFETKLTNFIQLFPILSTLSAPCIFIVTTRQRLGGLNWITNFNTTRPVFEVAIKLHQDFAEKTWSFLHSTECFIQKCKLMR